MRSVTVGVKAIFRRTNYKTAWAGFLAALGMTVAPVARAQTPPAIRALGPITAVSTQPLSSVAAAIGLEDGRVYVNDIIARRLYYFDAALATASLVADTTDATSNAYGRRPGTLIRYRGDSALYIDPTSLSMLVFGPSGAIGRVMAVPRPDDAQFLDATIYGAPAFDVQGRMAYYNGQSPVFGLMLLGGKLATMAALPSVAPRANKLIDSAFIVRVDMATRAVDTVASLAIPKSKASLVGDDQGNLLSIQTKRDPLPVVDDWTMMADGSIAIVRGRDFHVDWVSPDGRRTSSPKMPFDWQPVSDAQKTALIDSATKADQANIDRAYAQMAARDARGSSAGAGTGRGGGGGGAGERAPVAHPQPSSNVPNIVIRPELSDLPDYKPPFTRGAVRPDADGNLWIRTSSVVSGQPVYDLVNRQGELVDRVQLPPFRTIAGFAPGVIFMAVKDSAGVVHVERARVK
jgi:hypothetical protein